MKTIEIIFANETKEMEVSDSFFSLPLSKRKTVIDPVMGEDWEEWRPMNGQPIFEEIAGNSQLSAECPMRGLATVTSEEICAFEFGFRCCEKGMNLQEAFEQLHK